MGLKHLLEEHRKIYLWQYYNCQNIFVNKHPYVVSISNEISSFEVIDIQKCVLDITNNDYLESAKAFDILSNTLTSSYERKLSHLAIKYYYGLGVDKNNLHHGYLCRLVFLILKKYKSDKSLNEIRVGFKNSIFEWIDSKDNYGYLGYIARLDISLSNEEKQILSKALISSAQGFFSNSVLEDVYKESFIYLSYYDYAIKLSNKSDECDIRKKKITTLDQLAEIETDIRVQIHNKEQALGELKTLYKNDKNIEKEIIKRDKELKKSRLEWMDKYVLSFDAFEDEPSLKKEVVAEIEKVYQLVAEGIKNSKRVEEALLIFIHKKLPPFINVEARAKKHSNNSFIRVIADKEIVKKDGGSHKVKANEYFSNNISSQYDLEINVWYLSYLPRIFSLIKEKYSFENIEKAILSLSRESLIILPEREKQWFNCLINGFRGDFDISIGVVKQLENIIREILLEQNISIYKDDFSSCLGFGSLLTKKELDDILDKDCLGVLRWLFQNAFGPSLRNADAHGNLDDVDYDSGIMFFIWWFALRWSILTVPSR